MLEVTSCKIHATQQYYLECLGQYIYFCPSANSSFGKPSRDMIYQITSFYLLTCVTTAGGRIIPCSSQRSHFGLKLLSWFMSQNFLVWQLHQMNNIQMCSYGTKIICRLSFLLVCQSFSCQIPQKVRGGTMLTSQCISLGNACERCYWRAALTAQNA